MKLFVHAHARSVTEAAALLAHYSGQGKLNAGGSDLLGVIKDRILPDYPKAIINIKSIPGLNSVEAEEKGIVIGALTTLAELIRHPLIGQACPMLREAALSVASPQIRNVATLGGNLCQDTRCWYYRYPDAIGGRLNCFRKGGRTCPAVAGENRYHAIMGGRQCHAVCPSDTAVALTALGAALRITGTMGSRTVPVEEFYIPLGNVLAPDEMITAIYIPKPSPAAAQNFLKFSQRKQIDFAVTSAAALIEIEQNVCKAARIVLGAVAPAPVRASQAEEFLIGKELTEENAAEAAELALAGSKPLSKNAYKVTIAKALVKRVLNGN